MAHSNESHDQEAARVADAGLDRVAGNLLQTTLKSRIANVIAGIAYLIMFSWVYENYISIKWAYLGFSYFAPSLVDQVKSIALVGLVSMFLPARIERPSGVIIWFLYSFVFVSTVAVTYRITADPSRYDAALLAMTIVMMISGAVSDRPLPALPSLPDPPGSVVLTFTGIWAGLGLLLFVRYLPILSFAGIEDVYDQRFLAREASAGALFEYARVYFSSVFCPGMMAYGLLSRKPLFIGLGVGGFILGYAIGAEKALLIVPVLMFIIFASMKFRLSLTPMYTAALAALCGLCAMLTNYTPLARYFADLVLMRAIGIPGQLFSQYHDYFAVAGHTRWSHGRGLGLLIEPPPALANDPHWPQLGFIVGGAAFGFSSGENSNANLFVGDGVAAAGWLGVLVIGLVLIAWLRILDRATVRWSPTFVVLLCVPIATALTNGHLTTVLLSFGGLFWTCVFLFYRGDTTAGYEGRWLGRR